MAKGALSRETPRRRDLRWRSREAGIGYQAHLGSDWSISVEARRTVTEFTGEQPLFLVRRKDRTWSADATVSHRALSWQGYLLELTFEWTRTASNIPLHTRRGQSCGWD